MCYSVPPKHIKTVNRAFLETYDTPQGSYGEPEVLGAFLGTQGEPRIPLTLLGEDSTPRHWQCNHKPSGQRTPLDEGPEPSTAYGRPAEPLREPLSVPITHAQASRMHKDAFFQEKNEEFRNSGFLGAKMRTFQGMVKDEKSQILPSQDVPKISQRL